MIRTRLDLHIEMLHKMSLMVSFVLINGCWLDYLRDFFLTVFPVNREAIRNKSLTGEPQSSTNKTFFTSL